MLHQPKHLMQKHWAKIIQGISLMIRSANQTAYKCISHPSKQQHLSNPPIQEKASEDVCRQEKDGETNKKKSVSCSLLTEIGVVKAQGCRQNHTLRKKLAFVEPAQRQRSHRFAAPMLCRVAEQQQIHLLQIHHSKYNEPYAVYLSF